ncbi:MAG: RNA polymerase sigma factor SigZ [Candidatus Dadabacteria bacterium]|nr:MAG: RNA polymerase sigma factor SigZ [Candidatus Dadabacteria bacterium]
MRPPSLSGGEPPRAGLSTIMDNTHESARIWEEFSGRVRSHLLKKLRNKGDADDLLQEIFMKIHAHLPHLRERKKLSSWLYRITENTLNDYYRKRPGRETEFDENRPANGNADGDDPLRGIEGCLEAFIGRLPEKYREPLVMSDVDGKSQKEIAEEMGISYSGLKSRVQRGREMIKDMFIECCKLSVGTDGKLKGDLGNMDSCTLCGRD